MPPAGTDQTEIVERPDGYFRRVLDARGCWFTTDEQKVHTMKMGVQQMIAAARATITGHTPAEAQRRASEENALLVDIRDVRELQGGGVIPDAFHAPRGMLEFWIDPDSPYHKPVFAEDREFIFY